ncbi:MAG: hypothetical protein Q8P56_05130 [Candidatus Uhrbacteria bacterium]|nr:hypothetical protein [Candidatus Uhrbacteria bacterium]
MNFLANKIEYITREDVTPPSSMPVRIILAFAAMVICLELLILWQIVQPAVLLFREPTQAPRLEEDRVGILKRF